MLFLANLLLCSVIFNFIKEELFSLFKILFFLMPCNGWQYGMKRIASDFLSNQHRAETGKRRSKSALHRFLLYCALALVFFQIFFSFLKLSICLSSSSNLITKFKGHSFFALALILSNSSSVKSSGFPICNFLTASRCSSI